MGSLRGSSSIFNADSPPPPRRQDINVPPHVVQSLHYLSLAFRPREADKIDFRRSFTPQFISSRGNEYFCEIDEEYLTDRFNLTGLNTEVQYYQYALDLITDVFDLDADDELREQIEKSARHLYGLVHARYIVTTRGLAKMVCLLRRFPIYSTLFCFHWTLLN
jgi:casein kinase II subunit beta